MPSRLGLYIGYGTVRIQIEVAELKVNESPVGYLNVPNTRGADGESIWIAGTGECSINPSQIAATAWKTESMGE